MMLTSSWRSQPALAMEAAFETLFGLARDGKTNDKGMPNLLHGALLAREYDTSWPVLQFPSRGQASRCSHPSPGCSGLGLATRVQRAGVNASLRHIYAAGPAPYFGSATPPR